MTKRKLLAKQALTLPAFHPHLKDEIRAIGSDYTNGSLAQEFALLRVARLVIEELYLNKKIPDELHGGEITFTEQEQLVNYVGGLFNISRATIMSRLSGYRKLTKGLQMSLEESFMVMMRSPGVIKKMAEVAEFNRAGEMVLINAGKAIALPSGDADYIKKLQSETVSDEDKIGLVRPALEGLVMEAACLENRFDASKLMDERLGKNTVSFRHNGNGGLIAKCTERLIDPKDGSVSIQKEYDIEWLPNTKPADWVTEKLYSRVNAIDEK
jgi:hypothetical protein